MSNGHIQLYNYHPQNKRQQRKQRRKGSSIIHTTKVTMVSHMCSTFVLLVMTMLLSCQAFTPSFLSKSSTSHSNTIIRQQQVNQPNGLSIQIGMNRHRTNTLEPSVRRFRTDCGRTIPITRLYMAVTSKTGGKLIQTAEQYLDIVMDDEQERPILVFWTAPWCGPCRLSIPVVKDIIKQFNNKIDVYEVCTDDLPDVASDAGVVSIPTIHIYYRGKLFDTIIGCVAKTVLANTIDKALEDIALRNSNS
jgi:thioredoxin 1